MLLVPQHGGKLDRLSQT